MAKTKMGQNDVKPLDGLTRHAKARGPAPVHLWDPPYCGEIDIRIARDGTWFHEGGPIGREAMVRLFASVLKREGDAYFLVTPVEKLGITVEDVPFVAVDFRIDAGDVIFVTNTGDEVVAGPDHPIRMADAPYVMVRGGMEARVDRKSFYRLVDIAEDHGGWFGIRSGGEFFPLIRTDALG